LKSEIIPEKPAISKITIWCATASDIRGKLNEDEQENNVMKPEDIWLIIAIGFIILFTVSLKLGLFG